MTYVVNGRLIRRLRMETGLSIRELASRAAVNPGYLSRAERGQAAPSTRRIASVAAVFDIPTASLILPERRR